MLVSSTWKKVERYKTVTGDAEQNLQTFQKYELLYLEFRLSSASVWVAQEGDECRSGCVFFIVVLRAVTVNQLNQAVVVRQMRVRFTQTPGSEGGGENGFRVVIANTQKRKYTQSSWVSLL